MSAGYYDRLAEMFDKTKKWDPITPNVIEKIFEQDSRTAKMIGDKWNIGPLEQEAQYNLDNPSHGIAHAATATGAGFAGAALGSWLGGGEGGVNVGSSVSMAPGPGVVAPGMQKAAMLDSLLINSGNPDWAGYLGGMSKGQKFALGQAKGLLNPPQQQMPQYRPPQQQAPQPMQPLYQSGYMTEEEKRRLREQGYNIY
jgi:hypothetical protein